MLKSIHCFCFQPVFMSSDRYFQLMRNKCCHGLDTWNELESLWDNNYKEKKVMIGHVGDMWLKEMGFVTTWKIDALDRNSRLYNKYLDEFEIDINNFFVSNLRECVYVDREESGFVLLFDQVNRIYTVVFALKFFFGENSVMEDPINVRHLYYFVRNKLVLDPQNKNSVISQWAEKIRAHCKKIVCEDIDKYRGVKITSRDIYYEDNTGYMLFDIDSYQIDNNCDLKIFSKEILFNNIDEEDSFDNLFFCDKDSNSFAYFGWRFTTFFLLNKKKVGKCIALMFYVNTIYILINYNYKNQITVLLDKIRYGNYRCLYKNLIKFDELVLCFQSMFHFSNTYFAEIKPKYQKVYNHIGKYWDIDLNRKNILELVGLVKESVDRKISYKVSSTSQVQADILFVLAIIQILSVISIIVDYRDLLSVDLNNLNEGTRFFYLMFKENIAILLVAISSSIILFVYSKRFFEFFIDLFTGIKKRLNFITNQLLRK